MALVDCRECGHEVSTDADSCPNCGAPAPIICEECETTLSPEQNHCPNCGHPVSNSPESAQSGASQFNRGTTQSFSGYAGFWRRLVAAIADGFVTAILGAIGGGFVGFLIGASNPHAPQAEIQQTAQTAGFWVGTIIAWLYFAVMESSGYQATLGKRMIGLKVTDLSGEPISFLKATGRYFGKFISFILLFIGFLMAGWTEKKQALHDMMAGCLVVKE